MDERRTRRVSEAVREELIELIGFEMADPRLLPVEVNLVHVSPDGRHAHVIIEVRGDEKILLDASSKTVRFAREGVELDPGGIGKGYAVDRMVDILRRDGIAVALVSASG